MKNCSKPVYDPQNYTDEIMCRRGRRAHGRIESTDTGYQFVAYLQRFASLDGQLFVSKQELMSSYRELLKTPRIGGRQ